jgi:hypothetical protein
MASLRILIQLDPDGADVEDLYLARGVLRMVDSGYQEDGIDTPEFIVDKLNSINRELTLRNRADIERKLKLAKARRDGLKTRDERLADINAEIAKLEQKLNP